MNRIALGLLASLLSCSSAHGQEFVREDGVEVRYSGVSRQWAQAVARTVSSARAAAIETFQFDMPDTIFVEIMADPSRRVRLFNDGQDRFSLTVRSEADLAQPGTSGKFQLYGLCHEVGHLAMYRPIQDHSWLSYPAAEGWAHYVGSRLVDIVYEREGPELWPDKYDYRQDGMSRLQSQLNGGAASTTARSAGLWQDMAQQVGDKQVAEIFANWGKTNIDPTDPGRSIGSVLRKSESGKLLDSWWNENADKLVVKRPKSGFVAETLATEELEGAPQELAHDDGRQEGKNSSAGGGHAVQFEIEPGERAFLTEVRIHGSRYGRPAPPKEDFSVWLCDEEFRRIAEFKFPYSKFDRGGPEWVSLETKPTRVPAKFIVCVGFNPTGTKGVYVGFDESGSGNSLSGLPGGPLREFARGDWMIRATLDTGKHDYGIQPDENTTPAIAGQRTWTDATGKFSVVAEFVEILDGQVKLRKADGNVITLPLEKLSQDDQAWVNQR